MPQIILGRHNSELRFELVKIAFEQALRDQATPGTRRCGPNEVGRACVAFADAMLAEMEKAKAEQMSDQDDSEMRHRREEDEITGLDKPAAENDDAK